LRTDVLPIPIEELGQADRDLATLASTIKFLAGA
jgi:hypothetical protein